MITSNIKSILLLALSLTIISIFQGCAAAGLAGEVAALEGLSAAELMAARAIATRAMAGEAIAAASRAAIGVEEATLFQRAVAANTGALADAEALNSLLARVRLEKVFGKSPQLYFIGRSTPFAEVHANTGRLKILETGNFHPIPGNIFSVTGGTVNVRTAAITGDVITTVKQGDLLVTLRQEGEWYQIKLIRDSRVQFGWIKGTLIAPLVMSDNNTAAQVQSNVVVSQPELPKPKPYNCSESSTGDYSFTNKTDRSLTVRLYPGSTPIEYMGNPGMNVEILTLTAYESKTYYHLQSGIYKYMIMESGYVKRGNQRLEHLGQISVETCGKSNYDIRE